MESPGPQEKVRFHSFQDCLKVIFLGICMGAADIVPGISGGTVAFIMGFYENLLKSIKSFDAQAFKLIFQFKVRSFFQRVGWEYLLALISGIAFSFITLASFFDYVLGHEVYRVFLYSGFLGLILASIVYCAKQLRTWRWNYLFPLACGIAIAFFLTDADLKVNSDESVFDIRIPAQTAWQEKPIQNYDSGNQVLQSVPGTTVAAMLAKKFITSETYVYNHSLKKEGTLGEFSLPELHRGIDWLLVCGGAIAISAMLLPGISGSYLLTVLGMYPVAITAITDFVASAKQLQFDGDAFMVLGSLMLGIVIGALLFSHVVVWLLKNFHDCTIIALTGFMIGALRSVWPFWTYAYRLLPLKLEKGLQIELLDPTMPSLSSAIFWISLFFAVGGFVLVFVIEFFADKKSKEIH